MLLWPPYRLCAAGRACDPVCGAVVATYHPAAVLRAPDAEARERIRQALVDDLRIAARAMAED